MPLAFNRTIESPGVEIRELDLSLNVGLPVGTNVMVAGFAPQGPTDELLNITSITEFEQIFGEPTDAAERYFYHTCRQVLLKNGNLLATRLPYGSGEGAGFGSEYSALVYPVYAHNEAATGNITMLSGGTSIKIDQSDLEQYFIDENGLFSRYDITEFSLLCSVSGQPAVAAVSGLWSDFDFLSGSTEWANISSIYYEQDPYRDVVVTQGDIITGLDVGGEDAISYYYTISGEVWNEVAPTAVTDLSGFYSQYSQGSAYYIGQPSQIKLTEAQYSDLLDGNIIWRDFAGVGGLSGDHMEFNNIGQAGLVVVNKVKRTTNEYFEGQYVILADNTKTGFGTTYDVVRGFKTVTKKKPSDTATWSTVGTDTLAFNLTGTYLASTGTTSEIIESVPGYDFGSDDYNDSLILGVLKLRTSPYAADGSVAKLGQLVTEAYVGSLWYDRQIQSRTGGPLESFFLEDVVNNASSNIKVMVNPYISKRSQVDWLDDNNRIAKNVRVISPERDIETYAVPDQNTERIVYDAVQVALRTYNTVNGYTKYNFAKDADYGFAIGPYLASSPSEGSIRIVGDIPKKVEKALRLAENIDEVPLDILLEGGLGTIDTFRQIAEVVRKDKDSAYHSLYEDWGGEYVDDLYLPGVQKKLDVKPEHYAFTTGTLIDQDYGGSNNGQTGRDSAVANMYQALFQKMAVFCEFTRRPGTLFIADGLRQIFVQGNRSVLACTDSEGNKYNFPQHIYWGLRNLFAEANTSYACTYGNWVKAFDTTADEFVWLPFSGFAAGIMCDTDRNFFPWFAPAGLNRGRITDVVEIAINPTQKQRDLLYRHNINPICFFPQDGFVVWGQKTLFKKPSAFDRINVRRLFLVLEKATVAVARYFVFEPNTLFTRTRLVDAITPIFERAKNNEGVYDYLIICDERNNTPDVIDRNELAVDIYIKPVRAAEFILISFIATRTGQDFAELV